MRRWIPLLVFAVLGVFLYLGLYLNPKEVPSPLVGRPAPDFTLPVVGRPGETFSALRGARRGLAAEHLGTVVQCLPRGTQAFAAHGG